MTIFRPLAIVVVLGVFLLTAGFLTYRHLRTKLAARNAVATLEPRPEVQITIIEGKRREEIAVQLETAGLGNAAEFLTKTEDLEGRLFPDTYRFFTDASMDDIIATLTRTFSARTAGLEVTDQALIVASLVEREAVGDSERAAIAGVYQNRLDIGMKLDADPTVQYGKDSLALATGNTLLKDFSFWQPIFRSDYTTVRSPYNTYANPGLPPGPICNPGLKSIQAALAPERHSYYYFFHRNGQLYLSRTLSEHQQKLNSVR